MSAFVAVMAWGFGDVGYGPHRIRKILSGTSDAGDRLARVAGTLANVGPPAAYRRLAHAADSRLVGLGPAFGTKFLYFCQPRPAETTALVLDAFVAHWLDCAIHLKLDPVGWSDRTYAGYLDQMHRWATSLGCEPDELEAGIFRAEAASRASQWDITGSGPST